ncbi:MAG: DUF4010 domain-containing protein [Candidatus Marsarchaeota archaeon]|nr:DUF4010 domain-containing protein [Candidatus Marsarchaeota archaeon]
MIVENFISGLVLSLAVGGLIGLERQRTNAQTVVGLRSFALISMFGMILANVFYSLSDLFVIAGFIGVFSLSIIYYYLKTFSFKNLGITTAIVIPITFILGVLIGLGFAPEAGVSAIIITFLLVEKSKVHSLAKNISKEEIIDLMIFAIIAFILYPYLPIQPYNFLGKSIDLHFFLWVVVVFSLIGFIAHFLMKFFKKNGLLYASFFGGIISSLSVIYFFSIKSRDEKIVNFVYAAATVGSVIGDLIILIFINPQFFYLVWMPFVFFAITFAYFVLKEKQSSNINIFEKPLSLSAVLEFSALFFIISFLLSLASNFHAAGVVLASLLGGVANSMAVFASISILYSSKQLSFLTAFLSLFFAVVGSSIAKIAILNLTQKDKKTPWKQFFLAAVISLIVFFITNLI